MTGPRASDVPEDAAADDVGEPIEAIAALEDRPGHAFVRRVRQRIHRRLLGRQVTDFAWSVPVVVFMTFLDLMVGIFGRNRSAKGETPPWNRST